jgi:nucleoid-associated protein YgaU
MEQIRIAEKVLGGQGWGAWPVCSVRAHASGGPSTHSTASVKKSTTHKAKKKAVHHHHKAVKHVKLSGRTYTVKAGDTLSTIAVKKHVKGGWHRLYAANTSRVDNPNLIFIGQILRLPA